ncbi:synaptotagmin-7-like [Convolutriloba macropyga]|uniref:synaptotagmin-7-like n=1 Tax=Convolutriloba macropyga TaxID=536237 RepID=UPI003F522F06
MADADNITVKIIKARNVGGIFKSSQKDQLRIYCKVCLVPGKQQKQHTNDVTGTQDPVFKEAFLFKGLSKANLEKCKIRIRVYNKCSRLKRDEFLGEASFSLLNLPDNEMFKLWCDLTPKSGIENLGSLTVSLCLEKTAGILTVNVIKGKDLPRNLLTGAPDPYVKVLVVQESRAVLMKKTKVKRKTTCPVFKEVFTFHISTSQEDIQHTSVEFTVYDRTRIWSVELKNIRISLRSFFKFSARNEASISGKDMSRGAPKY